MKRIVSLFIVIIFIFSFSLITTSEFNTKRTLLVYFDNKDAQFSVLEVSYMMNEIKNYFASEGIFLYDINIANDSEAELLLKRNSLVSYIEFSGNIVEIGGTLSNFSASANITMRVYNTQDDKEIIDSLTYEGTTMATVNDAKALALAYAAVNVCKKNIDNIKSIMNYE